MALAAFASVAAASLISCEKTPLEVDRNRPPQTFLVSAPVDSSVENANTIPYSYRIHLYWRGEDSDGYVVGYQYSWDDSSIGAFRYTARTDSIFELLVNDSMATTGGTTNPGTARAHRFFIRAVDNLGKPDPSFTIFNSRIFVAKTEAPTVEFVGGIPSGTVTIDTLCDASPFKVCWTGADGDGYVAKYRFDVGTYNSPLITDTCAVFNDPVDPNSVTLSSGLYTMTVSAVDNANAVGRKNTQFVVNRDPETWFLPKGAPIGHYIQHSLYGQQVRIEGTFAPEDTVPYRSTVWWTWDGEDVGVGDCEANPPSEPLGCTTGWSIVLNPGGRNNNAPYGTGFLDTLATVPEVLRFKSNNPGPLGQAGFTSLILDSLDQGANLIVRVATRDCSNRSDGTPAFFRFNCNFPPKIFTLTVKDTLANPENLPTGPEPCKFFEWTTEDFEDGHTTGATVTVDNVNRIQLFNGEQSIVIPNRTFLALGGPGTHSVTVRVRDRAKTQSEDELPLEFNVP
jgi:hypothetical protein